MPFAGLSVRAKRDLLDIGHYTVDKWGETQAIRYVSGLTACADRLAAEPLLGRTCEDIRKGLRRFEQGKHVLFYRKRPGGIFVVRILHQAMRPREHL